MLTTLFHFFLAILGLGILIFIHELGHYWMAIRVGMRVETFSIGFGRAIWSIERKNGEKWQVGWLPFGGFVKIAGTEKDDNVDPYKIKDGFFGKSPWARIKVSFMGPLVNILFSLLIFFGLWLSGGRAERFQQTTSIVGWVDPTSTLYKDGFRPGDQILAYDGSPYKGIKDHLIAPALQNDKLLIEGNLIDYTDQSKIPFSSTITPYVLYNPLTLQFTTSSGVFLPAQYLIYKQEPLTPSADVSWDTPAPNVASSGIQKGDQIVWVDGDLLYSVLHLHDLINRNLTLLTIQRGNTTFLKRTPRVYANELRFDQYNKEELIDWQWEAGLNMKPMNKLRYIPYDLSSENVVLSSLRFIDKEDEKQAFSHTSFSPIDEPLEVGDQIVAVDGVPVSYPYQLLSQLQTKRINVIVHRPDENKYIDGIPAAESDFLETLNLAKVNEVASRLGTSSQIASYDDYHLLRPIEPKTRFETPMSEDQRERVMDEFYEAYQKADEIEDPERRAQALKVLKAKEDQLILGLSGIDDQMINVNHNPFELFSTVVSDIYNTLDALITGTLNPRLISGPIGIVASISTQWGMGLKSAFWWMAVISLNLGLINLIPLPVLDGGSICLSFVELITRKKISINTLERLIIPFVIALLLLLLYFTYNDIISILKIFFGFR